MVRKPCAYIVVLTAISTLLLSGCGGVQDVPEVPGEVSLIGPVFPLEEETGIAKEFSVLLTPVVSTPTTVKIAIDGTAVRDKDFEVTTTEIVIPAGQNLGTFSFMPYRDFDDEGDETVNVTITDVQGNATLGTSIAAQTTIVDGRNDSNVKVPVDDLTPNLAVVMFDGPIGPGVLQIAILVLGTSLVPSPSAELVVELSSSYRFDTEVTELRRREIRPLSALDFPEFVFLLVNTRDLPAGNHFLRAQLLGLSEEDERGQFDNEAYLGFAVNSSGYVETSCQEPLRDVVSPGLDPLFDDTWYLRNTGQNSYADSGGVVGEDLRMQDALQDNLAGQGVEVVVHDTGLQICHPDLKASAARGDSYNFNSGIHYGAQPNDPFLPWITGDHGTSVSGIIAATADNGTGSRGIAPGANLRVYNFSLVVDPGAGPVDEDASSLGASTENPNSSTGHIFNMSYGTILPGFNAHPDYAALLEFGTSQLRDSKGALYIRAAGNAFTACEQTHPIQEETGCLSANTDPDQNLPYMITVGGFDADGRRSFFSSTGSNLWVSAPGGGDGTSKPSIISTDQFGVNTGYTLFAEVAGFSEITPTNPDGDYTFRFSGTSAAAPATTAAVALMLERNSDLTWRDVKHILARTSRQLEPQIPPVKVYYDGVPYVARLPWITNAAGYRFHDFYGFGAINVDAAVAEAGRHEPDSLGEFMSTDWFDATSSSSMNASIPDRSSEGFSHTMSVTGVAANANIEGVVLSVSIEHTNPTDLGIHLISPSGTESILNPVMNVGLGNLNQLDDWELLSNSFYGENPNGDWTLRVYDVVAEDVGEVRGWKLRFYHGSHP